MPLTRDQRRTVLVHILENVLELGADSQLQKAIEREGPLNIQDFLSLRQDTIAQLQYADNR